MSIKLFWSVVVMACVIFWCAFGLVLLDFLA